MTHSNDFIDNLLDELTSLRLKDMHRVPFESESALLPDFVIKHWLNFAVYYERTAVSFIGGWLASVKD